MASASEKRRYVTAKVQVTLEVELSGTWSEDEKISVIRKQAYDGALNQLNSALAHTPSRRISLVAVDELSITVKQD